MACGSQGILNKLGYAAPNPGQGPPKNDPMTAFNKQMMKSMMESVIC
jgi:hypothetical protein